MHFFLHSSRSGNFFVQYIAQITGYRLFFTVTAFTLFLLGNLLGYDLFLHEFLLKFHALTALFF